MKSLLDLSFSAFFVCWLVIGTEPLFSQEQSNWARIEAKRFPDLPFEQWKSYEGIPFDIDTIKEFELVSGVCLGPDGYKVTGASIQLYGLIKGNAGIDVEEFLAQAETKDDGKFALEGLQAQFSTDKFERYFVLVVRKEGFATKFLTSLSWGTDELEVKLASRAMVKGVIKNDLGEPVPDAKVSFYHPLKDSLPDVFAATTDEEGNFQIEDFHTFNSPAINSRDGKIRGTMRIPLRIEQPDYGQVVFMIDRTPNLFMVTIGRGVKFKGRIVNEQKEPVPNCKISIRSHNREQSSIRFETKTNDDGEFRFTKLPNVKINLLFKTDDLIGKSIELAGQPGAESNLGDLTLVKPIVVRGVVVDVETNEPLRLDENQRFGIGWHGPERPKTSSGSWAAIQADGTFECRFLPGKNYPYVASGNLQVVDKPYQDGIDISAQFNQSLVFKVRKSDR